MSIYSFKWFTPWKGIQEFFACGNLGFRIRNLAQEVRNPADYRNLESKFYWQGIPESNKRIFNIKDCLGLPYIREVKWGFSDHASLNVYLFSTLLVVFPIAENHELLIWCKFSSKSIIEPKLSIPLILCVFTHLPIGLCQGQNISTRTTVQMHRTLIELSWERN